MSTVSDPAGAPPATSLAVADEIFLRCAPQLTAAGERFTAAAVIERDKVDLLLVLSHLADCMESNSRVNKRTGFLETHVDPGWFEKFSRALERHTGKRVEL